MAQNSKTIIQEDVNIKGNVFEKEDIDVNGEIAGDIKAENLTVLDKAKIIGNVKSSKSTIGGYVKGDIDSSKVHISKSGDVEGTIKQKTLSIEEGAKLKIKTETTNKD